MIKKHIKTIRFLISGGLAFLIDVLIFVVMYNTTQSTVISSISSMSAGFLTSFLLNKYWTFGNKDSGNSAHATHRQLILSLGLFTYNNVITIIAVNLFEYFNESVYVAKGICIIAITTWNYYLYNKYIFRRGDKNESAS